MKKNLNNMEKTIEQVKEDKSILENQISILIFNFQSETKCNVSKIHVHQNFDNVPPDINLTVEI